MDKFHNAPPKLLISAALCAIRSVKFPKKIVQRRKLNIKVLTTVKRWWIPV